MSGKDGGAGLAGEAEFRPLVTLEEWRACVSLQRATWGDGFADVVPASILQVSHKLGGFIGGAFAGETLIGFVYSLLGEFEGQRAHWSHMLAVDPSARGRGIGLALKLFQRESVAQAGIDAIFWTYDPMVARNAHLNINRLGASVVRLVPNMYGSDTGSPLHAGDTDRFIVRWDLNGVGVRRALEEGGARSARRLAREVEPGRVVTRPDAEEASGGGPQEARERLPAAREVFVEIPRDIEALPPGTALEAWRRRVRDAVRHYMRRGYEVRSMVGDADARRSFYVLERD